MLGLLCRLTDGIREDQDMAKGDISTYNEDGTWKSKVEGSSRAAHTGGTKAEQQAAGREMAKERGVEHTIRNMDGTIAKKNSYGDDKHPPKG
jgi:hypothetical protein